MNNDDMIEQATEAATPLPKGDGRMSDEMTDILVEALREHQKKRPDEPNDNFPMWCHDQYEKWQREDDSLRLILGVRLVDNALANKETES